MLSPQPKPPKRPQLDETRACPECGATHLVRDEQHGEVVCDACGLVISEGAIDLGPEWNAFSKEDVAFEVKHHFWKF